MTTPTSEVERLGKSPYLLLTTYRKAGTPVATPVWVVRDGSALLVWSAAGSYKVRRIRRNGSVTVAPCSFSGKPLGAAVPGHATILDAAGASRVRRLIVRKYWLAGPLTVGMSLLKGGGAGSVAISIAL